MSVTLTRAIETLIMPPGGLLLLIAFGFVLLHFGRGLAGRWLVFLGVACLWTLSLPVVADALLRGLEQEVHPLATENGAEAIVVLSGGRHGRTPEYGGDTVGPSTLERLRYAAHLHRMTGVPVLASGGTPHDETVTLAELMRRVLVVGFGVEPVWTEERSKTTRENALYSAAVLKEHGISRIMLVTHAWHMPRARKTFERHGLEVVPAPTLFTPESTIGGPLAWLPDANALSKSHSALHEWVGRVYYRLLD